MPKLESYRSEERRANRTAALLLSLILALLVLSVVARCAYAETNLDVAWAACVNASHTYYYGDYSEPLDVSLNYTWSDDLSAQCHQIQTLKQFAERAAREAQLKLWQDERQKEQDAKDKVALPLVQRALADPDGAAQ